MKKERSGFLSMAIGLTLVLVGVSLWEYKDFNLPYMQGNPQSQTAGANQGNQNNQSQTAGTNSYQSSQYGFSVQYPSDFTLQQQSDGSISFNVATKDYFHTVLVKDGDIKLIIAKPAATCNSPTIQGADGTSTTMIGSPAGSFQKISGSGVGAGQLYNESFYTLTSGGLCYSVDLVIHSTNGAGFYYSDSQQIAATDAQQAKDKAAFMKVIDQMVSTFTLTP